MNYLVTGCSRGVGLEICRVLLSEGNMVYGVARSYTDEFKKLESEYSEVIDRINRQVISLVKKSKKKKDGRFNMLYGTSLR